MMNYSMLEEARELAGWSKESEALSIYQALESIEDLRGKQGKRYGLALLLTCVTGQDGGRNHPPSHLRMDPLPQYVVARRFAEADPFADGLEGGFSRHLG